MALPWHVMAQTALFKLLDRRNCGGGAVWCTYTLVRCSHLHPRVPGSHGWEAQLAADGHGVFLLPAVAAALYLADAQGEGSADSHCGWEG